MEGDETTGGKRSKWMQHVMKTKRANKGKSLKQVLKMASKTYKGGADETEDKIMQGGGGGVASTALPLSQSGGRRRRSTRKSRKGKKGSRKH